MEINLITFNVLADLERMSRMSVWHEHVPAWDERKALCVQALHQAQPSIIGLQEVMPHQFDFFQSHLPEFSVITVPDTTTDEVLLQVLRETFNLPNIPTPHEVALFFRTQEFDHIATGSWWLSPTPDTPSLGFGGVFPRAVLWGQLRHRISGQECLFFNTHLDGACTLPMIELCREKVAAFTPRGLPMIFMGDFNFTPTHADYTLLTGDGWHDAHVASSTTSEATQMNGRRIDHIFYRGSGVTPQTWTQLCSPDPQRPLSDHHGAPGVIAGKCTVRTLASLYLPLYV
jgi:endonuclease/exonuclease/phosphatase family metal-dependent hydrolase